MGFGGTQCSARQSRKRKVGIDARRQQWGASKLVLWRKLTREVNHSGAPLQSDPVSGD
jgi:hypothetical protein